MLTNKICLDYALMTSSACFNRFSLFGLVSCIYFQLFTAKTYFYSERTNGGLLPTWNLDIAWEKLAATNHHGEMLYSTHIAFFFSPFLETSTWLLNKGQEVRGVHCNLLMCGWVPSSLCIPAARLQSS